MDDVQSNLKNLDQIPYYPEFMSEQLIGLLKSLLHPDPKKRAGCGRRGVRELRDHPFFEGIDWDALHSKTSPHQGGLFTGPFEQLPAKEPEKGSSFPEAHGQRQGDGEGDNRHLLRNFDLSEWEGIEMDDADDYDKYGEGNVWPLIDLTKISLDDRFIVGYQFVSQRI